MKKNILFFLLLLIGYLAQAQKVEMSKEEKAFVASLNEVIKSSFKTKTLKEFDTFKATHRLDTPKLHAYFYSARAYTQSEIHEKSLKKYDKKDANIDKIAKNILADYQQAIELCEECAMKNRANRFYFLKRTNADATLFAKEIPEFEKMGYKKNYKGTDLAVYYIKGQNNWVGGQISLLKEYSPRYHLKAINPKTGKKYTLRKISGTGASLFPINYAYNLDNKLNDFSLSLFQIEAPFVLNVTKIGFQNSVKSPASQWYYRPEIGVAVGPISLSLAYNFMFNKEVRAISEKEMLYVRFSQCIKKHKEEEKKQPLNWDMD